MRAGGRGGLRGGSGGAASTRLPPTCGGSGEAELESLDLGAERGHLLGGAWPCGRGTPTRGGGLGRGVVSLSMLSHCWCGGASRRATASSRHLPRDRRMRSKLEREGRSNPNATHTGGCGSHFAGVGVSATTAKQENLPATRYGARLHLRNYCYPAVLPHLRVHHTSFDLRVRHHIPYPSNHKRLSNDQRSLHDVFLPVSQTQDKGAGAKNTV